MLNPKWLPRMAEIKRGDIFFVDWSPSRGSEQAGHRPSVVVQNDAFNSNDRYPNTVVVTMSKSGREVPTHVKVPQGPTNNLSEPLSFVKCEQLLTISKSRLTNRIGRLTEDELAQVDAAVRRVLSV
jgi:mRNA interferase MazF